MFEIIIQSPKKEELTSYSHCKSVYCCDGKLLITRISGLVEEYNNNHFYIKNVIIELGAKTHKIENSND